jgi:hypothetical protein
MRICTMFFEDENGHDLVVAVAPRGAHFLTQTPLRNPGFGRNPRNGIAHLCETNSLLVSLD